VEGQVADIGRAVLAGRRLTRPQIRLLVDSAQQAPYEVLYWAHRVRTARFGAGVRLCSIVAGKLGGCSEDCKWCAQSARCGPGTGPARYAGLDDIHAAARQAASRGAASLGIVNSGRRPSTRELEGVLKAAEQIRRDAECGLGICASLGELSDEQAAALHAAGVTRYNHNLETSRGFFGRVVTTHTYEDRLETLAAARRAGMSLCCGGIFGLGESWEDRIDLAITLRDEVSPEVVPLNFLHPIPGTPLADSPRLEPAEILNVIAVFRLILPDVDLKIAGGRESNLRDRQSWMFYAGATSCIIGNYLTTPGRGAEEDLRMIADLGLEVVRELPTSHLGA